MAEKGGVISKKVDTFINLKKKPEKMEAQVAGPEKGPKYYAPSFYVSDIVLPIDEDNLNQAMTAEVKIVPKRVSKSEVNGKESVSYDFEITGIKFNV